MKFGNVPDVDLNSINLGLPVDHALTSRVLDGTPVQHPAIFMGSSNWGHSSWASTVYPPKTPAARFRMRKILLRRCVSAFKAYG